MHSFFIEGGNIILSLFLHYLFSLELDKIIANQLLKKRMLHNDSKYLNFYVLINK